MACEPQLFSCLCLRSIDITSMCHWAGHFTLELEVKFRSRACVASTYPLSHLLGPCNHLHSLPIYVPAMSFLLLGRSKDSSQLLLDALTEGSLQFPSEFSVFNGPLCFQVYAVSQLEALGRLRGHRAADHRSTSTQASQPRAFVPPGVSGSLEAASQKEFFKHSGICLSCSTTLNI